MINWTTSEELASRLNGYSPIGLRLKPFFHAKYDEDPTNALPRVPEMRVIDGLGNVKVWSGYVGEVPFTITCMAHPRHYGIEVSLPTHLAGDRVLFVALAELPLPHARSIYFETLPSAASYAVASRGDTPIYLARTREDATAAVAFAERAGYGPFTIDPVTTSETGWMVVGPLAGPYVSEVDVFTSEEEARRYAVERSRDTGMTFDVRSTL